MKSKNNHHIIEQVPPNYYQKGIEENILQKIWHTRKLEVVLSEIDFYPSNILDVGCASGWFLFQISKKFKKAKCTGIDVYRESIKFGKKKYPRIRFKVADAHKIPYKSGSFELVVCTEVLEHIDKPEIALKEIRRVLKKTGIAIIELDSGSWLFSVVWYLWRLGRGAVWKDSHLHSFNINKLEKMLRKTGFVIKKSKKFNIGMAMVFVVEKI